jgi:hypothetical protein
MGFTKVGNEIDHPIANAVPMYFSKKKNTLLKLGRIGAGAY